MKYSPHAMENLKALNDFIPQMATKTLLLIQTKNKNSRIFEEWREQQLVNFLKCLIHIATDLDYAYRKRRMSTVAWLTRNLLELSVWIRFCNLSNEKAKTFHADAVRDLFGLYQAVELLSGFEGDTKKRFFANLAHDALDPLEAAQEIAKMEFILNNALVEQTEPSLARQQFPLLAQAIGVTELADNFTKVHSAAGELGCADFFNKQNKVLSKFAHPTALFVLSTGYDDDLGLDMFLNDGVEMAVVGVTSIVQFVARAFANENLT
jgi:hypothetical protein